MQICFVCNKYAKQMKERRKEIWCQEKGWRCFFFLKRKRESQRKRRWKEIKRSESEGKDRQKRSWRYLRKANKTEEEKMMNVKERWWGGEKRSASTWWSWWVHSCWHGLAPGTWSCPVRGAAFLLYISQWSPAGGKNFISNSFLLFFFF